MLLGGNKMEYVIEFLFELLFEGSMEISANQKVPKWIRYPLICFIVLFFLGVTILLFIVGVSFLEKNVWGGLFIVAVSIFLLVSSILKLRELYFTKK